jgi:hypothetical protein
MLIVAIGFGTVGCGGYAPTSMTLYALDPEPADSPRHKKMSDSEDLFHNFAVLAKVEIATAKDRAEIMAAIENDLNGGKSFKCFDPGHGVRVVKNDVAIDYVICFKCGNVAIYQAEKDEGFRPIGTSSMWLLDRHLPHVDRGRNKH